MIRRTFLIARQEFIKYVTRRGFLLGLVMMPLFFAIALVVPQFAASHPRTNVMTVVDLNGGYTPFIQSAVVREQARAELGAIAGYAQANADMKAFRRKEPAWAGLFAAPDRIAAVKAFAARGGWRPAFSTLAPYLKKDAPAFNAPQPAVVLVPPPPELTRDFTAGRRDVAKTYLDGSVPVTALGHAQRLSSIIVIPKDFGPKTADAQYWSSDSQQSLDFVRWALTDALRLQVNRALVPADARDKVTLDVDAEVTAVDPTVGRTLDRKERYAQLVPMGLAFVLFIVAFTDAALLLQGVVEEKSTRMVEVLLSSAGPHEIMTGKLLGVVALALVTLIAWVVMIAGLGGALSSGIMPLVLAGLKGLLPVLPLVVIYFLCGLLIYCSIFLGIGATSSSLPDAQALVGPASMIIVLPNMLMSLLIQDPNGTLAQIISWIPIYTPFFMLVRLPFHPAPWELWMTTLLTLATTFLLVRQMGRVFARHVLTTERPPTFRALIQNLLGKRKAE